MTEQAQMTADSTSADQKLLPENVTDAQGYVLHSIEQRLPIFSVPSNTGGARRRMTLRMKDGGWLRGTFGSFELTELGMAALKRYQQRCMRRQWVR